MAVAAKQGERIEMKRGSADVVPVFRSIQPTSSMDEGAIGAKQTLQENVGRTAMIPETTKESARTAYDQIRIEASQDYSPVVEKGHDMGSSTPNRPRQLRQEHPLQLIAIIAGAAFAGGIAIRIWRSRAS